ncbi:MAG: tRNA (adenosine(37)-N6)-dimethylallyltransferase MiaA [Arenicella sp.]
MKNIFSDIDWETQLNSSIKESIPVFFIMGATATGKTDIAALLSKYFPAELVSVDSSLVYRGMDIGTAKPDTDFLAKYPHHLVDIREPDETYSVADFCRDVKILISDITSRGKVPILVGGTSFYFAALEKGLPDMPEADLRIRQKILDQAQEVGWEAMHQKLKRLDQNSAQRINANDPQRIQRALEIIELTGKPVVSLQKARPVIANPIFKVAMTHSDRKVLHQRIHQRFHIMMEQGLASEIDSLLEKYSRDIPAFRMIGYRQYIQGIDNNESIDSIVEKSIIATRQLAKRQLTWLRNQPNVLWQTVDAEKMMSTSQNLANYCQFWLQNVIRFK